MGEPIPDPDEEELDDEEFEDDWDDGDME